MIWKTLAMMTLTFLRYKSHQSVTEVAITIMTGRGEVPHQGIVEVAVDHQEGEVVLQRGGVPHPGETEREGEAGAQRGKEKGRGRGGADPGKEDTDHQPVTIIVRRDETIGAMRGATIGTITDIGQHHPMTGIGDRTGNDSIRVQTELHCTDDVFQFVTCSTIKGHDSLVNGIFNVWVLWISVDE